MGQPNQQAVIEGNFPCMKVDAEVMKVDAEVMKAVSTRAGQNKFGFSGDTIDLSISSLPMKGPFFERYRHHLITLTSPLGLFIAVLLARAAFRFCIVPHHPTATTSSCLP